MGVHGRGWTLIGHSPRVCRAQRPPARSGPRPVYVGARAGFGWLPGPPRCRGRRPWPRDGPGASGAAAFVAPQPGEGWRAGRTGQVRWKACGSCMRQNRGGMIMRIILTRQRALCPHRHGVPGGPVGGKAFQRNDTGPGPRLEASPGRDDSQCSGRRRTGFLRESRGGSGGAKAGRPGIRPRRAGVRRAGPRPRESASPENGPVHAVARRATRRPDR